MSGKAKSRRSLILLIVVVLLAVAVIAAQMLAQQASGAKTATIHGGDGSVRTVALDEDATYEIATDAGVNVVRVEGGRIAVAEADCPGQDCVNQGYVQNPGQQIVCLPHKLWIEIDTADEDPAFDTMGS